MRTSERTTLRRVADQELVNGVVEVQIPLSSTSYTDPTQLYNSLVADLATSVESGAFTTQLASISALYGATQLLQANVTDVIPGALVVEDYTASDDSKNKTLSSGEIAIIAFCGLLAFVVMACVYYRYCRAASPTDPNTETTASALQKGTTTSNYRQPYYGE